MASSAQENKPRRLYELTVRERKEEMRRLHASAGEGRLLVLTTREENQDKEVAAFERAAGLEVGSFLVVAYINRHTAICGVSMVEQSSERITRAISQGRHEVKLGNKNFGMTLHVFKPPRPWEEHREKQLPKARKEGGGKTGGRSKEKASKSTETSDDKSKTSVKKAERTVFNVIGDAVDEVVLLLLGGKKERKGKVVQSGLHDQTPGVAPVVQPAVALVQSTVGVSAKEGPQQTPAPEQPKAGRERKQAAQEAMTRRDAEVQD